MIKRFSNISLPFLVYSIAGLFIFGMLFFWIHSEKVFLDNMYTSLESPANRSFAVLQEFHPKGRKFTYQVSDERGRIHEITEVVDESTARKLRVGDTISIYRKTIILFSKRTVISKILTSERTHSELSGLYSFTRNGAFFFGGLCLVSFCFFAFSKKE